jgi:hypothetical protein
VLRPSPIKWRLVLLAAFLFRVGYGLTADFWTEDERQVFLVGLRSYARGEWPFFGADVVWTHSQVPGALLGLLIGLPFRVWTIPESPVIFLNVLSFAALCLFGWYCERHATHLPRWLIWGWLLTAPWTLNFSTHIVNPSYILPGSIVFFVGFFEAVPGLGRRLIHPLLAFAMMGFGLLWLVQIHLSWVLLPPFAVAAFVLAARSEPGNTPRFALAFALGCLPSGSMLIPTVVRYGAGALAVGSNAQIHLLGPSTALTILARFLSFPSFELNRFLGLDTASRLTFLFRNPWLIPPGLLLGLVGLVQPVALAALWFSGRKDESWRVIKVVAVVTVAWIYVSFFFSIRGPLAHSYYVTLPIAMLYSFYCWDSLAARASSSTRWRPAVAAILLIGVVFHVGQAAGRARERSLYVNRPLVQLAVSTPDDRLLGNRRTDLRPPWRLDSSPGLGRARDAFLMTQPQSDIEIVEVSWSRTVFGRVSSFRLSLRNGGSAAAYLDLQLATSYIDGSGATIRTGTVVIKQIVQPGERRTWDQVVDGFAAPGAVQGRLRVLTAEKCVPARLAGVGVPIG